MDLCKKKTLTTISQILMLFLLSGFVFMHINNSRIISDPATPFCTAISSPGLLHPSSPEANFAHPSLSMYTSSLPLCSPPDCLVYFTKLSGIPDVPVSTLPACLSVCLRALILRLPLVGFVRSIHWSPAFDLARRKWVGLDLPCNSSVSCSCFWALPASTGNVTDVENAKEDVENIYAYLLYMPCCLYAYLVIFLIPKKKSWSFSCKYCK